MNMKKIITVTLLSLALLLSACNGDNTGEVQNDNFTEESETTMQNITFLVSSDGTSPFTVVYEDVRYDIMAKPSVKLKTYIEESLGTSLKIATDFLINQTIDDVAGNYEILIGDTNRPETAEVKGSLEDGKFAIKAVGNKLVICGQNNSATLQAIDYFIENISPADVTSDFRCIGDYIPDPLDTVLEDKSTGVSSPRIIDTVYETDDVVIADIVPTDDGYAVSNNGIGDSTAGIQKALNDCKQNGGGTVYLPVGKYIVTDTINIPAYVTLRGDWQDPDTGNEYGTVIEYRGKSEDVDTKGMFMLGGSGGVVGLTVYYHDQSVEEVKPYPFTFYTDGQGDNYMLSTVKNCTVINGYRGIGACCTPSGAHEQITVENVKGTYLYTGSEVYNQADVGTWQGVTVNAKYWLDANESLGMKKPEEDKLTSYMKENTIGLILGDLEWTEFSGLYVDGCKIGVQITYGKRIQFAGSMFDVSITDCSLGIDVVELDERWGMVIANSVIEGGINNATDGLIKLCGVTVSGDMSGNIEAYSDDTSEIKLDYTKSYVKPNAKLYTLDRPKDYSSDMSDSVQSLLDEAGKEGGVVYLPGGIYRFDKPIVVPAGVELRGSSSVATRDQGGGYNGTLIYCYYGDDAPENAETAQAFITLDGDNAGINGIRIRYPENTPYDEDRTTTYAVRGNGNGVYAVNCSLASADLGFDFTDCDDFFIKKVSTCCYTNSYLLGGKGGTLTGCLQNGTVIQRCGSPEQTNTISGDDLFPILFDRILRRYGAYITIDSGEDITISNTFCYGIAKFLYCKSGSGIVGVNLGADNIGMKYALVMLDEGDMTVINLMRYNGKSIKHEGGHLKLYNRITINDKSEATYDEAK